MAKKHGKCIVSFMVFRQGILDRGVRRRSKSCVETADANPCLKMLGRKYGEEERAAGKAGVYALPANVAYALQNASGDVVFFS